MDEAASGEMKLYAELTVEVLHRTSKSAEVGLRRTMVRVISMLTIVHPFAAPRHFPSRGNEKYREAFPIVG